MLKDDDSLQLPAVPVTFHYFLFLFSFIFHILCLFRASFHETRALPLCSWTHSKFSFFSDVQQMKYLDWEMSFGIVGWRVFFAFFFFFNFNCFWVIQNAFDLIKHWLLIIWMKVIQIYSKLYLLEPKIRIIFFLLHWTFIHLCRCSAVEIDKKHFIRTTGRLNIFNGKFKHL